jgi:glycerol 2-dehydrogenase (NADP+)
MYRACPQQDVVDFCTAKGIVIQAYSPLGSINSPLFTNPVVKKIAEKHKVQPANVISLQANKPNVTGKFFELYL